MKYFIIHIINNAVQMGNNYTIQIKYIQININENYTLQRKFIQ